MGIVQAFQTAGAQVTMTTSLKQALVRVEHDGLAVAILDHALHEGDSAALCARLKERNIPFVIYSGFFKVSGVAAEAPLVRKPATADVLKATLLIATVEALLPAGSEPADSI